MQIFEWLVKGNFFNFLILMILIGWLFIKFKAANSIENATREVAEKLDSSAKEKEKAQDILNTAIHEEENLPIQLDKIKEEAKITIESFKTSSLKEFQETERRLMDNAQRVIAQEKEKLSWELQKELAIGAVNKACDRTLLLLEDDSKLHKKFIADSIEEIERLKI